MSSPTELMQLHGRAGYGHQLGLAFDTYAEDRLIGHLDIGPEHHQPFGQVHGGVWCAVVESFGSVAGLIRVTGDGKIVVGVSNTTDFLRPVRDGRVDVVATPLHIGRSQHLWQVVITRPDGKVAARGQVRLQVVDAPNETQGT